MNILTAILSAAIISGWITAIAIVSVQNVMLVSLQFLGFNSIQLPVGVLLAFAAGFGWLIGAITPQLLRSRKSSRY